MPLHTPHTPWNPTEVQATVRSYLDMLVQELAGQRYNKSACRKLLFDALAGARSQASIEFKYCNISAVLQLLHYPSINGYKRRINFQKSLMQEVERQIPLYPQLSAIVQAAVEQPAAERMAPKFEQALQSPPSKTHQVSEALAQYAVRSPVKRDYRHRKRAINRWGWRENSSLWLTSNGACTSKACRVWHCVLNMSRKR